MEMGDLLKKLLGGGLVLVVGLVIVVAVLKLVWTLVLTAIPIALLGGGAYLGYRWWKGRALPSRAHHGEGSDRW